LNVFVDRCFHCGADILPHQLVTGGKDNEERSFCCRGCLGAYLLITGAGLADFYRRRETDGVGLISGAYREEYGDSYLARFIQPHGVYHAIDILIDGIRCAACVWLNEKVIGRLSGVIDVRVNYATNRARVVFDEATTTPSTIFHRIVELGYVPRPYTRSAAEETASRERRDLLIRFGTSLFLTMQLMAYSFALYAGYFQGMSPGMKRVMQYFSLLVTAPVVFYSGKPFLAGAWRSVRNRAPNMDLLIAIGALSSFFYSIYAMFSGGEVYFETAAMIVTFILSGRLLEQSARRRAVSGVERLLSLAPTEALRISGDLMEVVDVSLLKPGEIVLVGAGERIPVDGTITAGSTEVDESPATGESLPVPKGEGDCVVAGSINLSGTLRVRVERPASDSFIARVARLVEDAQSRKAPVQGITDRVSAVFVPTVLLLAAATFFWLAMSGAPTGEALMTALAVVLIACPCALGLATPTAILAGTGAAAAGGVVFRGGDVLERLSRISSVLFDKTGTLTCGRPAVIDVQPFPGVVAVELVSLASSLEAGSRHPLASAVVAFATWKGMPVLAASDLLTVPGGGVMGTVGDKEVVIGSERFLRDRGITGIPDGAALSAGETVVHVARDGSFLGSIFLRDTVRPDAGDVVGYFVRLNISPHLLSGDRRETACRIAAEIGIAESEGDLLPEDKAAFIDRLRGRGETTLMVGDGINDAPALSAADIGCAIAGGTDIAIETSDLVLARPELSLLCFAHLVSRRTMSIIRQNLAWAFVYNLIGIPLAITGRLTPVYAAVAMALSSLCVVGNSLRLTRIRPGSDKLS